MKAMIMAAGVGTRLMPLTSNVPKPMVPVANVPVMEHAVNLLKNHGITNVIANLHYLPCEIKNYFGDGSKFGVKLKYSEEKELLGTAGGVKNNQWFLDETFVVLSGDGLTDINLQEMLEFHKAKGALATIALKHVDNVEQFGVAIADNDDRIQSFQEKPKKEEALSNCVNTGIYIFEPQIFDWIPEGEVFDFGKELFPLLVQKGLPFYGYKMEGYWCDIGTLEVYHKANNDVLNGEINTLVPIAFEKENINCGDNVKIHPTAKVFGKAVIGEGTVVGKNVELWGNVVIGTGCIIEEQSIIENSILWNNVNVQSDVAINESLIGKGSIIERGAILGKGSVLSDNDRVKSGEDSLSPNKSLIG